MIRMVGMRASSAVAGTSVVGTSRGLFVAVGAPNM
jgi:hypothetical protein